MKILGLTPYSPGDGHKFKVKIYSYESIDVPFEVVAQNYLVDWDFRVRKRSSFIEPAPLYIKDSRKIIGLISYDSLEDLADFYVNHYIPKNNFSIDHILKNARKLSNRQKRDIVLACLIKQNQMSYVTYADYYWDRRYKRNIGPEVATQAFFERDSGLFSWTIASGLAFLKRATYKQMVYIDTPTGRNFLIFIRDTRVIFYWDGKIVKAYYQDAVNYRFLLKILGKEKYEEFEKRAKSIAVDREYIPPQTFKPDFFLRVPAKNEVKKLIKKWPAGENKPNKKFNRILFLYDSRGALKIDKPYPRIDSLNQAVAILSRSPNWVFIPQDTPTPESFQRYLEDKQYYLIAGGIDE